MNKLNYRWLQLRRYIRAVETMIDMDQRDISLPASDQQRLLNTPELELDLDFSYEELIERIQTFPHVLRRSLVLTIWIVLEDSLNELAHEAKIRAQSPFAVDDLRGRGVVRAVEFLSRLLTLDLKLHPSWPILGNVQALRNAIVHSNGVLATKRHDELRRFIASDNHLGLSDNLDGEHVIEIHAGFADSIIDVAAEFHVYVSGKVRMLVRGQE